MRRIWIFVLVIGLLSCNGQNPDGVDQVTARVDEIMSQMAEKGDLFAKAVVASGLNEPLAKENYPLVLVLVNKNGFNINDNEEVIFDRDTTFKAYVAEQGLTEEQFLEHPKLRDYMESYLVPGYIDFGQIRITENGRFAYKTVSGREMVFTTRESPTVGNGDAVAVNGVNIGDFCFFDFLYEESESGHICFADAPIVKDFDWSR